MILKFIDLKEAHTNSIHNIFKKKYIARFEIFVSFWCFSASFVVFDTYL